MNLRYTKLKYLQLNIATNKSFINECASRLKKTYT